MHRFLGAPEKHERHAVAAWNANQFSGRVTFAELRGAAHDVVELLQHLALLVHQQLRVAKDVNKQDLGDLELDLFLNFSGHNYFGEREATIFSKRGSPRRLSHRGLNLRSPNSTPTGFRAEIASCSSAKSFLPACTAI